MSFNNKYIENYIINGFNNVEGWCEPRVAEIVDFFDSLPLNKEGGACEIGIHHGKLFLLLNQTIEEQYKSFVVFLLKYLHSLDVLRYLISIRILSPIEHAQWYVYVRGCVVDIRP